MSDPVEYTPLGGDASQLAPKDLLKQGMDTLLASIGIPADVIDPPLGSGYGGYPTAEEHRQQQSPVAKALAGCTDVQRMQHLPGAPEWRAVVPPLVRGDQVTVLAGTFGGMHGKVVKVLPPGTTLGDIEVELIVMGRKVKLPFVRDELDKVASADPLRLG